MRASETTTSRRSGSAAILVLVIAVLSSAVANAQTVTLGEAVDNTSLAWTTGGDRDWFGQTSVYYYGGDAAQSGDVAGGQSSWLQTAVTGPGILSFYWKVSSSVAWTDLEFYIDGVQQAVCWADSAWERKAYAISSGSHILKWTYAPSLRGYAGLLDKVEFIGGPAVIVGSPNGGETWYHRSSNTIKWMSTEDVRPSVKLELYQGESREYTVASSTENDGSYRWFVPTALEPGADYRIKISSISDSSVYDFSDSYFSIAAWSQSSFGGFLVLDGGDDYALADDHPELDVGDEADESLTIEAWFNIQSGGSFSDSLYMDNS
jgi:hypothetical protein